MRTTFSGWIACTTAGVPPLAEIRGTVEQRVREHKKWDVARRMAKDYIKRLEEGSTMAQAAAAMKLAHREFGPFSRVNPPLTSPMVVGAAFGLDAGKTKRHPGHQGRDLRHPDRWRIPRRIPPSS